MTESRREEIAKLEALYAANPEGRVFTHLAEAYRKAGELDLAREILERGLSRHADYASGHVVLGRVLMDMGRTQDARAAFQRVLELDRHNLIALRSLGELAVVADDMAGALQYYHELITLDPGDDVLRATISRLEVTEEASAAPADDDVGLASADPARVPDPTTDDDAAAAQPDAGLAAAEIGDDDLAAAADQTTPGSGEVMTETIAELYAAQGLHARAADVYRLLLRERPGDEKLRDRLMRMESFVDGNESRDAALLDSAKAVGAAPEPGPEPDETVGWLEHVESVWTGGGGVAGAGPTPYAWTDTALAGQPSGGAPISRYFDALLAWRPASLAVDGVGGSEETEDQPAPWLDAASSESLAGDVAATGGGELAAEEDEDLDMFRSWLQSLKK